MQITGSTRVFMILGDPIAQVRAPEQFNHLFARHGIDAVMVPARVAPRDLASFVGQIFKAENFAGLLLTIPHKAAMLPLLDRCDRFGTLAQAVNAVRRNADGAIEGALLDGIGFVKALDQFGIRQRGSTVLLVGVGGGGIAIAASLAERGVARLALYDPDTARCVAAAAMLKGAWPALVVEIAASADPAGFDCVINASPLGLKADDPLPFDPARLYPGAAVVDILMKNQPTPLLRACHARGVKAHPGFEMLIQQTPEYMDFFGLHPLARTVAEDSSELRRLMQAL
ncbi:MAG TPA: shikimate dehydrogenase [Burkholderiaceae bacterium]